jgi:myo-inositol 2-dehydrogenase / D-chiro-inositol 1-dehydrogenase
MRKRTKMNRREFLGASAVAGGFMILKPGQVRGSEANSAVRIGLLGCGGRGTVVATGFIEDAGARVTALADLFPDQLEVAQKKFNEKLQAKGYAGIDPAQIFKGPDAVHAIAASKEVDAILIATPPYFHPAHLEAVVAASKHVYCEKPIAIDVPGAKHAMAVGKQAQGKLSLAVGFQIRKAPPYVELIRRIHGGAIGTIGCGLAYYYCPKINRPDWPGASAELKRFRNWVWDRKLSGDIIVEQNIHVIDICNWALQSHPIRATGANSRRLRDDSGDSSDNFNVVFTYPGEVHVSFGSSQFDKNAFDASIRLYGTRGSCEAHYDSRMSIAGDEKWDAGLGKTAEGQFSAAGTFRGALDQADSEKQKSFVASITSGQFLNEAETGAESALTAILGRTAAYTGKIMTWEKLMKSKETLDPRIDINKLV